MLAKIDKQGNIKKYPYTMKELQDEFPNTSLPSEITEDHKEKFGIVYVKDTPKPSHDLKYFVEGTPEKNEDGEYVQVWVGHYFDDSDIQAFVRKEKEKVKQAINQYRDKLFYQDMTVVFPSGTKYIQFRNEVDRNNLADKVQKATIHLAKGENDTKVNYISRDNSKQTLKAEEMVEIGQVVSQKKEEIVYRARELKDQINALELTQENLQYLRDYQVEKNW